MIRRALAVVAVATGSVVGMAAPAAAHGGPGGSDVPASNYRSRVLDVAPTVDGLTVRTIEAGARVELVNRTDADVTVMGYEGEPFLRIGPDGVYENSRSPSLYVSRDRQGRTEVPDDADADAEPEWRRVGDAASARWHDHRAHWMGGPDPQPVRADRDSTHVIYDAWEIPLAVGDRTVTVTGDLTWIPGPNPWPWYAAAAVIALAVGASSRSPRWRLAATVAIAALTVAAVVDAAGVWGTTAQPTLAKLGDLLVPLLCVTIGLAGLVMLRRAPRDGLACVGAAGGGFLLLFGLANTDWLARSQIPTTLAAAPARLTVAAALGFGAGAVLLAVSELVWPRDIGPRPTAEAGTLHVVANRASRRANHRAARQKPARSTATRSEAAPTPLRLIRRRRDT